jgi:glyoxylase-like metal-dependent hydrolase (beta-lactamase superfamily II)
MSDRRSWVLALGLIAVGCSGVAPRPPALTQNRELEGFAAAAAYPNAEPAVALLAAQQYLAAHREQEGYELFKRLAREQPDRPILLSLEGMMQARMAGDVALLKRIGWVEDAIRKLDRGAEAEPIGGRLVRGLVFAELPGRFGKGQQALADLQASLANRDSFRIELDRGILRAMAAACRTLGDEARSRELLRQSGAESLEAPAVVTDVSVGPEDGFRFTRPALVREGEGIYVAEGFDFGNIAFLVNEEGVVAIDAGTTEESARAAMTALRRVTTAPVRYLILTHSHWDHVGGLAAVREAGTVVIARSNAAQELARMRSSQQSFGWFFGAHRVGLQLSGMRLVSGEEVLRHGKLEIRLLPASGGETNDALFVHLPQHRLLFVGDAFMPYVGPPLLSEGSPEGYLEALAQVQSLAPRRLIHGHPALTRFFNMDAIPGLEASLRSLYERYRPDALHSRPLAEMLHDNFLPPGLRETPKAVIPYLVLRDHFLQRLHQHDAGYWQSNGEGMELSTRAEWAAVLDRFGNGTDASFSRVAEDLLARGDAPLALRVAELGLLRYGNSEALRGARKRALAMLIERYHSVDPFRFIIYSQWADASLRPVADLQ